MIPAKLGDRTWLEQAYKTRGYDAIGAGLGVSGDTVRKHVIRHNITRHKSGQVLRHPAAIAPAVRARLDDANWLHAQYATKSIPKIARELQISTSSVRTALVKHNIARRHGGRICWPEWAPRRIQPGTLSNTHWTGIKRGARIRGLEVTISKADAEAQFVAQNGICRLSGVELQLGSVSKSADRQRMTASLDRIDSTKGYVVGNIQWVHKDINRMKWTLSSAEFVAWCERVTTYSQKVLASPAPLI